LRGLSNTLAASPNVKILCEFSPLSMMEAGIQPVTWMEWIENQGFSAIAYNGTVWSPLEHDQLKQELDCLTKLDFIGLTSELRKHSNASIADAAVKAATECGYPRPILENLLLVKQQTLQELTDKSIVFSLNK